MRKTSAIWLVTAFTVLLGTTTACTGGTENTPTTSPGATTYKLSAAMDTRQVVTSKNRPWKPPASVGKAEGTFTGSLDPSTGALAWHIRTTGMGKPQVMIADIHFGAKGHFGGILVRLCGPCKADQQGDTEVKTEDVTDILSGNSWVTVITDTYADGLIRGQIKAQ